VGAAITLFPAAGISLAIGLLEGAVGGTVIGAVAGHVSGGMKRSDLKDLGELLDDGTSGLVVVAATDLEAKVDAAITRAKKRATADLQADTDALKQEIERAGERSRGAKA
jgi:uncharacterized membrane protein